MNIFQNFRRSVLLLLINVFFFPIQFTYAAFDLQHKEWDIWLKKYVTDLNAESYVDYKTAKTNKDSLKTYLKSIEHVKKIEFDKMTEPDRLAFLINAYNAFTVLLILDNYPISSIKDLGSLFSSPWKKDFFTLFQKESNLDDIEHNMIRKWFVEPRIHFACVCASKGCPSLRKEAYVGSLLDQQLEDQVKKFLTNKNKNTYKKEENQFQISKIFDWYEKDFTKKYGSVKKFIAKYMVPTELQSKATEEKAKIKYLDYDWSLNEK